MRYLFNTLRKYLRITFYLYGFTGFSDYYMSQAKTRKIKSYAEYTNGISLCMLQLCGKQVSTVYFNNLLFFPLGSVIFQSFFL
jgi:hypothetical protein